MMDQEKLLIGSSDVSRLAKRVQDGSIWRKSAVVAPTSHPFMPSVTTSS
jgi:hypothetical protein